MKLIIDIPDDVYEDIEHNKGEYINTLNWAVRNGIPYEERSQGEYKTACNVLLSLEQIVRSSDGWEDSAVESVHNAVQTAIKCMHERPQGECRTCIHRDPEDKKCDCGGIERQGCIFPVSDDYFCKFYEKGGAEE